MINKITKDLINNKCWRIGRSYGSMLVLDFGNKISYTSPRTGINYKGEWILIVKTANWILKQNNIQISTGESEKEFIDKNITLIEDKSLLDIIDSTSGTNFIFQDNIVLEIPKDSDMEEYDLYRPDKYVLTVGPDHKILHKDSTK